MFFCVSRRDAAFRKRDRTAGSRAKNPTRRDRRAAPTFPALAHFGRLPWAARACAPKPIIWRSSPPRPTLLGITPSGAGRNADVLDHFATRAPHTRHPAQSGGATRSARAHTQDSRSGSELGGAGPANIHRAHTPCRRPAPRRRRYTSYNPPGDPFHRREPLCPLIYCMPRVPLRTLDWYDDSAQ